MRSASSLTILTWVITARAGEWPVILLDEVMAELDLQRRGDLLNYVGETEQVLLTTTDLNLFTPEFTKNAKVWRVERGRVETEALS
jgi:DNA replication and repair protein RecF